MLNNCIETTPKVLCQIRKKKNNVTRRLKRFRNKCTTEGDRSALNSDRSAQEEESGISCDIQYS